MFLCTPTFSLEGADATVLRMVGTVSLTWGQTFESDYPPDDPSSYDASNSYTFTLDETLAVEPIGGSTCRLKTIGIFTVNSGTLGTPPNNSNAQFDLLGAAWWKTSTPPGWFDGMLVHIAASGGPGQLVYNNIPGSTNEISCTAGSTTNNSAVSGGLTVTETTCGSAGTVVVSGSESASRTAHPGGFTRQWNSSLSIDVDLAFTWTPIWNCAGGAYIGAAGGMAGRVSPGRLKEIEAMLRSPDPAVVAAALRQQEAMGKGCCG